MNLLSFRMQGRESYGAMLEAGIVDLAPRMGRDCPDLRALLQQGRVAQAAALAAKTAPDFAAEQVEFLPPVPFPEKIICVGINYANRNAEYQDMPEIPEYPSIFMRTPGSLVGHHAPILRPRESKQLDYEGEIALIIGKAGRRIPEDRALQHVAGLACMNEGTIRDWLRHGKFNVTQGKNFARTGAIGPWMTTLDAFERLDDLRVTTRVNGEVRQDDTTASLIFSFAYLIRYISTFAELTPGDVIATGTPVGAGARFKPPRWLVPGDTVEVEVSGIGRLVNPVIDEA